VLVGQTITLNLLMAPSNLQETVTVTGEAPLIETQSSELAGNIDPRQVQDLPSLGRNWMTSATFLQPQPSANLSYAPRTVQLGFRLTF